MSDTVILGTMMFGACLLMFLLIWDMFKGPWIRP